MGTEEYLLQKTLKEGRQTGIEKGIDESKTTFVKSLWPNTGFANEKIAFLTDVTVEFVQKVKTLNPHRND